MSLRLPQLNCQEKSLSCPVNGNTFPGKLWKLVNDVNYESIRWSSCGTTVIVDPHQFKEEVLRIGEYSIFKTQNFSSFVRQLNLYGFRKLATTASVKFVEFNLKHESYSRPLHCFAHVFFVQHRPDLLAKVRRTTSVTKHAKRRSRFDNESYFCGQYGNTFKILSRYGPNAASSNVGHSQLTSSNYFIQPVSVTLESSGQYLYETDTSDTTSSSHLQSSFYTSASDSECSDIDNNADNKSSNSSGLFNRSSANVLWGQGQQSTCLSAEEDSPQASQQLTRIAKAEKGPTGHERSPEGAVSFPTCFYDTHGRLQKFVVVQQSPKLGVFPRNLSATPPSGTVTSTGVSPTTPAEGFSYCKPIEAEQNLYDYHQVVDYSSAQFPYTAGYTVPFMSDFVYFPNSAPPENMMSAAYHPSDPVATSNSATPSPSNDCTDDEDEDDVNTGKFQKVVVKQAVDRAPQTYYHFEEEEEEDTGRPRGDPSCISCWEGDCRVHDVDQE